MSRSRTITSKVSRHSDENDMWPQEERRHNARSTKHEYDED